MEPSHETFHHPYHPYDIQIQFMKSLYQCLENGSVGIFESPTGTGKSLSLICATLTWLRDNERRSYARLQCDDDENLDWLARAEKVSQLKALFQEREELEKKLRLIRDQETHLAESGRPSKRVKTSSSLGEQDFVPDDYESQDEAQPITEQQALSSSTQALLAKLAPKTEHVEEEESEHRTKIVFCSRTHSQLTQIVHELQKVEFPGVVINGDSQNQSELVKHLPLGSRRNLCINPKVNKLPSTAALNERCLELQQSNIPKDQKCEFLPSHSSYEDKKKIDYFKERAISQIRDIEDIGKLGQSLKICPYYASRSAIPLAEILTLPYPLLLQKSAREALGVRLKDNIVIIDEAHNLVDAIADTFSVNLPLSHLELAKKQVTGYCQKFKNKLKGKNRVFLAQLIRLLGSCTKQIQEISTSSGKDCMVSPDKLFRGPGLDQIQPQKLLQYLQKSKFMFKVEGYADYLLHEMEANSTSNGAVQQSQPKGVLAEFQSLLAAYMNPTSEGKFFVSRANDDILLKYTLLDPREHFRQIVEEARSVILAGGTMSPMSQYGEHLFSYLNPDQLKTFSFGHVIQTTNLMVEAVLRGPTGIKFDFRFTNRQSTDMIIELGKMIEAACKKTPDGCVAFFPSYEYLAFVVAIWNRANGLMDKITESKEIFIESKGIAADTLLREYSDTIESGKGALMLAVVGGKLSEGINFSDALGRLVICIGLPFPNAQSAEWKAKVDHLETSELDKLKASGRSLVEAQSAARALGRDYADNTTMRAVNQSIGRAIRHRCDYAAVLLIDQRYATPRIQSKLPGWMRASYGQPSTEWQAIEDHLCRFFAMPRSLRS